jgi:hypothetical protein
MDGYMFYDNVRMCIVFMGMCVYDTYCMCACRCTWWIPVALIPGRWWVLWGSNEMLKACRGIESRCMLR